MLEATGTALSTLLMVVVAMGATLAARTTLTLLIPLWFGDEHTVRELVLTCLGIDLKELHLDLVTFLDTCILYLIETLPVDLRDMEQTVLTRKDLYEATVRHD